MTQAMTQNAYLHCLAYLADLFWNQMERSASTYGMVLKSADGCRKAEITVTIRETPEAPTAVTYYVTTFRKFPGAWQSDLEVKAFDSSLSALDYAASQSCTERAGYLKA